MKGEKNKMIAVNDFVKEQHTPESKNSHFAGTWEELLGLVEAHFAKAKLGYRDGVVIVEVPPEGFLVELSSLPPKLP